MRMGVHVLTVLVKVRWVGLVRGVGRVVLILVGGPLLHGGWRIAVVACRDVWLIAIVVMRRGVSVFIGRVMGRVALLWRVALIRDM